MKKQLLRITVFMYAMVSYSQQSIGDLVNQTDTASLTTLIKELSGEQNTIVGGNTVTITHRVSNSNNDLAADYIKERLEDTGLTVVDDAYSAGGRNIIATQTGVNNPNDIYVIGAHYDSFNLYGADDNASGTAAVIELARMLAPLCLDKTLVYALWDEEEIGLKGSAAHATQLNNAGANVLGVFNIDMMAYDGDDDNEFDIDVRNIANSVAMKDAIVAVLNDTAYGFTLDVNVVNPGTSASDHSSFWNRGYSALLFGESWERGDVTPGYHESTDRDNLFNYPYYYEMFNLVVASVATFVDPIFIDKTITQNASSLTVNENGASYQWIDCDNSNTPINGETSQVFTPSSSGNFAVEITKNGCTQLSDCVNFTNLSTNDFELKAIKVYPNPVKEVLKIEGLTTVTTQPVRIRITAISGKQVLNKVIQPTNAVINVKSFASGNYLLQVSLEDGKEKMVKFLKE